MPKNAMFMRSFHNTAKLLKLVSFIKNTITLVIVLAATLPAYSQTITRVEPQNWWTGMKHDSVLLLVYGNNIAHLQPAVTYAGVDLVKTESVENKNYLFITLHIKPAARPGVVKINFKHKNKVVISKDFPLLAREPNSATRQSFSAKDAIFLLVPDRFANGDTSNDMVAGMKENAINRNGDDKRHGGDIQGIINQLDYIHSLGFTQIWSTPLIENNQPLYSYHGYAATDFYKIDPRFGTNEQFKNLVQKARQKGIGVIWDVVLNHCGDEYYFIKDLPTKDWIHYAGTKVRANHSKATITDLYASEIDKTEYSDGWFDGHMPDLNQKNPLLAKFLIQNSIWWIEYAGISGFREDTYSYSDKEFLVNWTKAVLNEYPHFNIVAEEMTTNIEMVAYWQKDKINTDGYKSYIPTMMDFALTENLVKSFTAPKEWHSTWRKTHESIAQDYQFAHPENLMIFPDNHDMDRFFSRLNKDMDHWKMAIALYTTMRGIPQFFYGTEVLMTNEVSGNDGLRRGDFYGGWKNDVKNAVTGEGLSATEIEAQRYFSTLLNWRKNKTVIHSGRFKHYVPQKNDVYVYFRYNNEDTVMVILNKNEEAVNLDIRRYSEMVPDTFKAIDVISGKEHLIKAQFEIPAKTAMILEIK